MSAHQFDWGLLSVADVLDDEAEEPSFVEGAAPYPLEEFTFLVGSSASKEAAAACVKSLVLRLKADGNVASSSIEDFYRNRSVRLNHSLFTFQKIHERIAGVLEFIASTVPYGKPKSSLLGTIALLGLAFERTKGTFCNTLLRSVSNIEWNSTSPSSCLDILNMLNTFVDEGQCDSLIQSELLSTKLSVALRSGRLGAVLTCLLPTKSTERLPLGFSPPTSNNGVVMTGASVNDFFIRSCAFPAAHKTANIFCCSPAADTLISACDGDVISFSYMGMMGTRLQKREEYTLGLGAGESIIAFREGTVITASPMAREGRRLRYTMRELDVSGGKVLRSSILTVNTSRVRMAEYHCYFAVCEDSLVCLLGCKTPNTPRCRALVVSEDVEAVLSTAVELDVEEESSVLRRDVFLRSGDKALHFSYPTKVQVGRVTLKDRYHPFCIELWVYPRNVREAQTILSIGEKSYDEVLIELEPSSDGLVWRGGCRSPQHGASFTTCTSPGGVISSERWWHVGLNFTGTTWELWLDQHMVSSSSALVSAEPITDAKCVIGTRFAGFIAEVRIWDQKRSAVEFLRDARRSLRGSEAGLCGYYPLSEGHGDLIADLSRGGHHCLLSHNSAHWCSVDAVPIAPPVKPRLVEDFVPLALVQSTSDLYFAVAPHAFLVATFTDGPAMVLLQYDRTDGVLVSQLRIQFPERYTLRGISFQPSKDSTLCWAVTKDKPDRLLFWEIYSSTCVMCFTKPSYESVWRAVSEVVSRAASYAQRLLVADTVLMAQPLLSSAMSLLVIDPTEGVIRLLYQTVMRAVEVNEVDMALNGCHLLSINLLFRCERTPAMLVHEVGGLFDSPAEMLRVMDAPTEVEDLRYQLLKLSLTPSAEKSDLMAMCCRCFLSEASRITFMSSAAGRRRTAHEERLFSCLVDFYTTVQACSDVLQTPKHAELLYGSLIRESSARAARLLHGESAVRLQQTSRCLEIFQEILFAKYCSAARTAALREICTAYTNALLRASQKTIKVISAAVRVSPQPHEALVECLQLSHVGSLLPSLTVTLPYFSLPVLTSCIASLRACRESFSILPQLISHPMEWVTEIGAALTFSHCFIGCALLSPGRRDDEQMEFDEDYLHMIRGGTRKSGTERDIVLKNLLQGVGSITKVFEELQKSDMSALRVVRDEQLKSMERQVMAAFCALLIPTKNLKEATRSSLEPAFRHVLKLRWLILSKRQESKDLLDQVSRKAVFLSQFDVFQKDGADAQAGQKPHTAKVRSTQYKWAKLFKMWKATRELKALRSSLEDNDSSHINEIIARFLLADVSCEDFERALEKRTQEAQFRLSGLLLLKQLIDEASTNPPLARMICPIIAKTLVGWHYAEGPFSFSREDTVRLQGVYFQLLDAVLEQYFKVKHHAQRAPWAALFVALITSEFRSMDYRLIRQDVQKAFYLLWRFEGSKDIGCPRLNGRLPSVLRNSKLEMSLTALSMTVGECGLTLRGTGGRGACVGPVGWHAASKKPYTYYFEVSIVDLLPGSSFNIGVGPADYSLSRLPGWDRGSFALQSDNGMLFTGIITGRATGFGFVAGDTVGCGWNVFMKQIFWTRNGKLLLATDAESLDTVHPLMGFDGVGVVRVNFGAEPFRFGDFPQRSGASMVEHASIGARGWDAFRAFSMRAAMRYQEICKTSTSGETTTGAQELGAVIGICFRTLAAEIDEGEDSRRPGGSTFCKALLSHCRNLALLVSAVPKHLIASHAVPLASALSKVAGRTLTKDSTADEEERCVTLHAWFHVMHLIPPELVDSADKDGIEVAAAAAATTNSTLLSTLLLLLRPLCACADMAPSPRTRRGLLGGAEAGFPAVMWTSLALLQRMNSGDGGGHSWMSCLDAWVRSVLHDAAGLSEEVLMALAILGGGSRLAVPGDSVSVRYSKHNVTTAVLVRYSLPDEVCQITEDDTAQKFCPLRLVDLIISDGNENYFPTAECTVHDQQAAAVLDFASRLWAPTAQGAPTLSPVLHARLLSVLWRCVARGVVQLPRPFVSVLSILSELEDDESAPDARRLRIENVWVQDGLAQFCQHPAPHTTSTLIIADSMGVALPDARGGRSLQPPSLANQLRPMDGFSELPSVSYDAANSDLNGALANPEWAGGPFVPSYLGRATLGAFPNAEELEEFEDEEDDAANHSGLLEMDAQDAAPAVESTASDYGDGNGDDESTLFSNNNAAGVGDSDELFVMEPLDSIQFSGGHLCVTARTPVGRSYTVDLHVRLSDIYQRQILFAQRASPGESRAVVARVANAHVEFGEVGSEADGGNGDSNNDGESASERVLCRCQLSSADVGQWFRLSFVQSGSTLSLFRGGTLQDSVPLRCAGQPLLQNALFIGDFPTESSSLSTPFYGDMRGIRMYEIALSATVLEQLHVLTSLLSGLVESHLCILLRGTQDGFDNFSCSPTSVQVHVRQEGEVRCLKSVASHPKQTVGGGACMPELDFGYDHEDVDLFTLNSAAAEDHASNCVAVWKKVRHLPVELLTASHERCSSHLASHYSICILAEVLSNGDQNEGAQPPEGASACQIAATQRDVVSAGCVWRLIRFAVNSSHMYLYNLVAKTLQQPLVFQASSAAHEASSEAQSLGGYWREALRCILHVAQMEHGVRSYESSHPYFFSTGQRHVVHVSGQSLYHVYFDPRCLLSNTLFSFSADPYFHNALAQIPGFALAPFAVHLTHLVFDIRGDTSSPQWGYKFWVVYNFRAQLRAMRLFYLALTAMRDHWTRAPAVMYSSQRLPETFSELGTVARISCGKTRRIALASLVELLFLMESTALEQLPLLSYMYDIRHMAERQYRRRSPGQVLHCRLVQIVAEFHVAYWDAHHSMLCEPGHEGQPQLQQPPGPQPHGERLEREDFARRRAEQRMLYALRDGGEHIQLHKMTDPQNIFTEWNTDQVCFVRSEGAGGSMVAGTPLTAGRWYFEVRVEGAGDVFIGVIPNYIANLTAAGVSLAQNRRLVPIVFNGRTGMLEGESGMARVQSASSVWQSKDCIGVLLDLERKVCSFHVNGMETAASFSFGPNENLATAADGAPVQNERNTSYFPFFALESGEALTLNFGGSHFDFEPPRGYLPLDPYNLTLGTLIPYNQLRAFQDLSAHVLTAGRHPMPPFFYEEANPFANTPERSGSAHVTLHALAGGVEVTMLDVTNVGVDFNTVAADCSVRGGRWYYEVTLRTQGLMQIGWATKGTLWDGSVGDTNTSWSVDLFRRATWHKGVGSSVAVPRRWSVGDVIGCALDIPKREVCFSFNGRVITSCSLATTPLSSTREVVEEYVPAISMRSGNSVSFNFGSTTLKHKPDGFSALGMPDSWRERIDTFYANEKAAQTMQRRHVLRELWCALGSLEGARRGEQALRPLQVVAAAVDSYCKETGKRFVQITEEALLDHLRRNGYTDAAFLSRSWERWMILCAMARVAEVAIPLIPTNAERPTVMTRIFQAVRTVLVRPLRGDLVAGALKESHARQEHFRVSINRIKAHAGTACTFPSTVFGQTFSLIACQHPRLFHTSKRFWSTTFIGEGAEDVGGPYREHMSEMCAELMSDRLSLFVPSANNVHRTGTCQHAYVPCASATSSLQLASYVFVGQLMGGAIRSEEPLGLFFPPLVWRYMCGYPVTEGDLDAVDRICLQCIRQFRNVHEQGDSKEAFDDVFGGEKFVTRLSDHSLQALIPNGENEPVTYERAAEYAEALLNTRIHEFDVQLRKMREGMLQVVPELVLLLLTPEELEYRVCGQADYKVEELRSGAVYEGLTSEDRRVLLLWRALEEATPTQRRLFLRFVSGRDRLPVKLRVLPLPTQGDVDNTLPRAATCFFAIEVPDYSTLEVMKHKLYYSIENCVEMDTDFNARDMEEDEGPQLIIGTEENRPDEISTAPPGE